jgi:lipopolysaccharide transport system ATP-binding protein
MSHAIITVDNLSKRYLVGHRSAQRERYTALRDVIVREARTFARKALRIARGQQVLQGDELEEFWALRDVSFEVKQGEVIGIIGRNGAGKSTLLKILSRISEPTGGRITLRGRVASLLEVGTGFHSELTGRENIFLNGAILGMKRREIRKRFDEIVAFAEVERFLDTPVKRYSSGMYVRLAFAVAAHLEPEILIVDEVLAVGDSEFQRKCLHKMGEVSRQEGRTILFVSHNMETVLKICNRALLLHAGQIRIAGDVKTVVSGYLRGEVSLSQLVDLHSLPRTDTFPDKIRLVQAAPPHGRENWSFFFGEEIGLNLSLESKVSLSNIEIAIGLYSSRGFEVASWTNSCESTAASVSAGLNVFRITYQNMQLLPGQYYLGIGIRSARAFGFEDYIPNAIAFEVLPSEKSAQINAHTFGGVLVPSVEILHLDSFSPA